MSSFYEDASLVMIPSGYKTSKVYCAKPTDGTGDLTFTRSNDTATRVASNGLIEKVRTNLNPNGNLVGLALNTNPTGYTNFNTGTFEPVTNTTSEVGTFCKFTTSATRSFLDRTFTGLTIGQAYAFSYKVQAVSGSLLANQSFTFSSGVTLSSFYINGVSSPTGSDSVTTGLIYIVGVATSTSISIRIGSGVGGATTAVLEIGNFQLESSDIATDYIPTTTAAVSVGPVANVPRLDYLNSTCPKLLLEPQRTNDIPNSENIANWTLTNLTRTLNQGISPDGFQNADLLAATTSGSVSFQSDLTTSSLVIGQPFVVSFFIKLNASFTSNVGTNILDIRLSGATVWSRPTVRINLETGEVTSQNNASYISSTNFGNGWFRITFGATPTGTSGVVALQSPTGATMDGGSFYIWGLQGEANATYATSYIPTLGASVTRGEDACVKTGISSLIGQTEGVIFLDWVYTQSDTNGIIPITISNGTGNTNSYFYIDGSNKVFFDFVVSGIPTGRIATGNGYAVKGTRYKMACAYKENDFVFYINGTQIGTDNSGGIAALSQLDFAYPYASGYSLPNTINQALLFKTRLSNQELQDLTTL